MTCGAGECANSLSFCLSVAIGFGAAACARVWRQQAGRRDLVACATLAQMIIWAREIINHGGVDDEFMSGFSPITFGP
jgi:hypothetical protein